MTVPEQARGVVLVVATLTTGLMAGLFYAYACSVMPALRRADDRTFVDVMQRINVAILNPWFLSVFVGALLSTLAAAVLLGRSGRPALPWVVAALVLYVAVFVVTSAANVPLNDRLAAAGAPDRIGDLTAVRERFETAWVRWNVVRAVLSTGSFGCLAYALVLYRRRSGG